MASVEDRPDKSLRALQDDTTSWAIEAFGNPEPDSPRHCLRLLEEVVELCLAAGASAHAVEQSTASALWSGGCGQSLLGGWLDVATHEPGKVPEELADVAIVLLNVAGRRGVDLQAEIDRKMATNRARRWRLKGDGTGYHENTEG